MSKWDNAYQRLMGLGKAEYSQAVSLYTRRTKEAEIVTDVDSLADILDAAVVEVTFGATSPMEVAADEYEEVLDAQEAMTSINKP